jgi:hypothetical protein
MKGQLNKTLICFMPIAWKELLKSLNNQQCVLLIGPDLIPGMNLFSQMLRFMKIDSENVPQGLPRDIAMVYPAEHLFLFPNDAARTRVWRQFEEFYEQECENLKPIYELVVGLPFSVVINTMPNLGLRRTFEQTGVFHQFSYYDYRGTPEPGDRIQLPVKQMRLIFNLFGVLNDHNSLVLTHDDLFLYFSQILGDKKLSSDVYIELSHSLRNATDFIFVGFHFDHWSMQMLLRLLNPEKNKSFQYAINSSIATETRIFFADQFEVEFVDDYNPMSFLTELTERWNAEEQSRMASGISLQNSLQEWLRQGYIERILEKLDQSSVKTDATFQMGRLNQLRQAMRDGVVSGEQALLEMNRIRKAVQDLIEATS